VIPIIISIAVLFLCLGLDDVLIDLFVIYKKLKPKELLPKEKFHLNKVRQKKIAVLVPAWKESQIISKMLRGNIGKIDYENYHFFVGCYPNDLPTFRAVSEVAREASKVTAIVNSLPGPTSKGQLLNSMIHELLENHYPCFDIYLFHDAEDIIHPLSLKLVNSEANSADFIQIPVFSLPIGKWLSTGATYMDEFAEVHTRDLLVRQDLKVAIPSAGVGFALTRKGLFSLLDRTTGNLFDPTCLTEDYVLGIRSHQAGLKQSFPCVFEAGEGRRKDWIATYEYFPKQFVRSIRQKARWTQGISLQSATKLGWFGTFANCLFLFRDRKALLSNCLGAIGLFLIPLAMWGVQDLARFFPLFVLNSAFLLVRLWQRAGALKCVYPDSSRYEVFLRYPLAILINGLAGFMAIRNHSRSIMTKSPTAWVKTEHELPEGFGKVPVLQVKAALILALLGCAGCASPANAQESPCIQIFFDEPPRDEPNYFFGRIHTTFIQNLLGHFPRWHQKTLPIQKYQPGQLDQCEANIYLGSYFKSDIPASFISDYLSTKRSVLWAGYHIWKLSEEELARSLGMSFKGLSHLDPNPKNEKAPPHFFKYFHYKGEVFEKYGDFDSHDPKKFNSAFELVVLEPVAGGAPKSQVLAWAEHSGTHEKMPYVVVNENRWYMADSPFAFATEKDRYLIFTDLLFDLLGEAPRYGNIRPAFVRFEDIHPNIPLWQLDVYSKIFEQAGVPFAISLIPIFADPLMVQVDDRAERFVPISKQAQFREFLKRAETRGSSIIYHGVTHQYRNIKNPFNGMSGDDFEFWDGVNNKPIPEDSVPYVLNRLEDGWDLLGAVGITPCAWLTPHYQASPLDFVLFGQLFHWNIGRVTYFPHQKTATARLPEQMSFNSSGSSARATRLEMLKDVQVSFPKELKPSGQFFPYEIWGDVFGQRLLPENLGNIQPFLNEQVLKTQDITEMIESAKRNRVLRDHWASLFIHPVLIQPRWEEGLGDYPGDGRKVLQLLTEISQMGYQFIDLKEWVKQHPLFLRPEPKGEAYESP